MDAVKDTDLEAEIEKYKHKLHLCRYYVHRLRVRQYAATMASGMSVEHAREMYQIAMSNFDQLVEAAGSGEMTEADQLDMDLGFPYPNNVPIGESYDEMDNG